MVLSVIVTGAKAFPHGLGHIARLVGVTTIVFWLAHVYAHVLAFSLSHDTHLSLAEFAHIARREASILAAGVPPKRPWSWARSASLVRTLPSGSRSDSDWRCSA